MPMDDTTQVACPYCFETVDVYIDPESEGELIRDCDVCCHPWMLHVGRAADGSLVVRVARAQ